MFDLNIIAGAFGTAMATVAALTGKHKIVMYTRNPEVEFCINKIRRNPMIFTEFKLEEAISATTKLDEALSDSSLIINCLPAQVTPDFISEHINQLPSNIPFVNTSKGMIVSKGMFISEYLDNFFPNKLAYCVLSGPSFAEEMMKKNPTLVVVASKDKNVYIISHSKIKISEKVQQSLYSKYFRPYLQSDVIGVEVAGALKNILAIGVGIVEGLGFGINTSAALITLGAREIQLFAKIHQANPTTLLGLPGIVNSKGDMMLTGFGRSSRNRAFGLRIAKDQGEKIEDILKTTKGVVEGLPTMNIVYKCIMENQLDMPITKAIYNMTHGKMTPDEAMEMLMLRKLKEEFSEFGNE